MMGIAVVVGMVSIGALTASADDSIIISADKQAIQKFTQETTALATTLAAKKTELAGLYSITDVSEAGAQLSLDVAKVNALEAQIKVLRDQISAAAQKYQVQVCSSK